MNLLGEFCVGQILSFVYYNNKLSPLSLFPNRGLPFAHSINSIGLYMFKVIRSSPPV